MSDTALKLKMDLTPKEVRERLSELREQIDQSYFEMAKLLWHANEHKLWKDWGYQSFRDYVDSNLQFEIRKAQILVQIWSAVVKVNQEKFAKRMAGIGWSKAAIIAGALPEAKDPEELVDRAEKKGREELRNYVKKLRGERSSNAGEMTRMDFTLLDDQRETVDAALKTAMDMMPKLPEGTTYRSSLVLAYVCQAFLAGQTFEKDGRKNLQMMFKKFEKLLRVKIVAIDPDEKGKDKLVFVSHGAAEDLKEDRKSVV